MHACSLLIDKNNVHAYALLVYIYSLTYAAVEDVFHLYYQPSLQALLKKLSIE